MTTTASPHTKPTVATVVGAVVGVLSLVQGYFTSGHLPSSAEVASIAGGLGLTGVSVLGFIYHYTTWMKTVGPVVASELPVAQAAVAAIPGLDQRIATLEGSLVKTVQDEVSKFAPAVNVEALVAKVKSELLAALSGAAATQAAGAPAGSPAVPAVVTPAASGPAAPPAS
jgi:hypothetical protein